MRDIALVILRLIVGVIFIFHGWDKIFITGIDKTTGYFVAANLPQAELTVWVVALVELIGGALLILGLLAPTVAMVFIIEMVGAWWSMHLGNGLFVRDNGAELVLALIGGLFVVFVFGAGRFSLDRQFTK
ncbi:DoxX family protein [Corynebacterium lactis]|nr:DoxX family protein [Corynebacterium lactis]